MSKNQSQKDSRHESQHDFQILNAAFENALDLEGEAQSEFLQRFAETYPNLAQRLKRLLQSDANDQDLLQSWIHRNLNEFSQADARPWLGTVLDKWRIQQHLGSGGMGAVFKAERVDGQYAQTVAIKVLAKQLSHPEANHRFRAERQILANLNHPNIATLIDGGTTDTQVKGKALPYLVMEYVKGVPINVHCREHELTTNAILKVLIHVCGAVDYAHRHFVIHRDLKPENILVKPDGTPKLLDFGIAKLLEPSGMEKETMPPEESRALTPEYASPEQVLGEKISPATDVYALGVNLYHLLTGHSPYGHQDKTWEEVETAILEHQPASPSTLSSLPAFSVNDKSLTEDSEIRLDRFKLLDAQSRLDLDQIILKCLQKKPEHRYATGEALADDLKRFLAMEPVVARNGGWVYKTGKFLRRRSRYVAAGLGTLMLLSGLSLVYQQQVNTLSEQVDEVASVNVQLQAPSFRPPNAITSPDDVPINGYYQFKWERPDGSYQINEFRMLNDYTLQVRNTNVEQDPGRRWFVYIRVGPQTFQAKTSTATYTLLDNGELYWQSDRRDIGLIPVDEPKR